jgi:hypothetical protein
MANNVSSLASDVLVTPESCKRCETLQGNVIDQEVRHPTRLTELLDRSGMDISPCRKCGFPVISIPDGLALCKDCAEKAGE